MPERLAPVGDAVLAEQLAYYRARADEYDDWFFRRGRYDRGRDATKAWVRELDEVRGWLGEVVTGGDRVLELASGTGLWTRELLELGAEVTAVDAAPEMLQALRRRVGDAVSCVEADLFTFEPPGRYDAVVSCFFMSHVPDERLGSFFGRLARAVRPGGGVFLLDSLREATSTASDHALPDAADQTMLRRLDDGSTYRIVKRFRDDAALAAALAAVGVPAEVRRTATYFQAAVAARP